MGWGSGVAMGCGMGSRCGSDPKLLWLWCRPAATALIQPLAWEPPYAKGEALKSQQRQKKQKTKNKSVHTSLVPRTPKLSIKQIMVLLYNGTYSGIKVNKPPTSNYPGESPKYAEKKRPGQNQTCCVISFI